MSNSSSNFAMGTPKEVADQMVCFLSKWSFTGGSGTFNAISAALWRNYLSWNSTLFTPSSFESSLGSDGEVGEYVKVIINQARTVGQQYISLLTRQRLYWEAITDINSASVIQDTRLAKGIANAVTERERMQQKMYAAVEKTFVYGASFISSTWRTDKGYPYSFSQEENKLSYSGDVVIKVHDVSDCVYDWSIEEWDDLPWVCIRTIQNRYDVIATHKDLESELMAAPSARSEKRMIPRFNILSSFDNPDMIFVWEFYLKPCPSVPKGRMVIYVTPDCILADDDNLYECIPVEPLIFSKVQGTGLGYPNLSTMLPAQEIMDGVISTIASNVRAFATQNIIMPSDSDIDPIQITEGMNVLRYTPVPGVPNGGEPKVLDLLNIPAELFNFANMMNSQIGDLSSLSSTVRGNPPTGVTAGNAIATLTANATEFLSQAQGEYSLCVQKIMSHALNAYKRFATVEQTTEISGESGVGFVKTWSNTDLKHIKGIKLRQSNSVMDSLAGRLQVADNLLAQQLITAGQYVKIQSGAPIDSIFQDQFTEELAVQAEVEAILENKPIIPILTDDHPKFIIAYQKLLYNPAVRANSQITGDIMKLMETRINLELQFQQNFELYEMIRKVPSPARQQQMAMTAAPKTPSPGATMRQPEPTVASPASPAQATTSI